MLVVSLPVNAGDKPAPQAPAAEVQRSTPLESLQHARQAFKYGDWPLVERLLTLAAPKLENAALRAEAWRMLGLSLFYQPNRNDQASAAFIELLTLEPDEELDPFDVSPRAIAFFEQVKAAAEEALRPVREARRAEVERRRVIAEAESAARHKREKDDEDRRMEKLRPPILERRVVQREFWVSLMPFGVGQFQNGDQSLGTALATSQIVAGATSAGSALLIEALRDRSTGKFTDSGYPIAQRLQIAKWIGTGAFYALWAFGAVHATIRYKPETTSGELVLPSDATPAGAPPPPPSTTPPPVR